MHELGMGDVDMAASAWETNQMATHAVLMLASCGHKIRETLNALPGMLMYDSPRSARLAKVVVQTPDVNFA